MSQLQINENQNNPQGNIGRPPQKQLKFHFCDYNIDSTFESKIGNPTFKSHHFLKAYHRCSNCHQALKERNLLDRFAEKKSLPLRAELKGLQSFKNKYDVIAAREADPTLDNKQYFRTPNLFASHLAVSLALHKDMITILNNPYFQKTGWKFVNKTLIKEFNNNPESIRGFKLFLTSQAIADLLKEAPIKFKDLINTPGHSIHTLSRFLAFLHHLIPGATSALAKALKSKEISYTLLYSLFLISLPLDKESDLGTKIGLKTRLLGPNKIDFDTTRGLHSTITIDTSGPGEIFHASFATIFLFFENQALNFIRKHKLGLCINTLRRNPDAVKNFFNLFFQIALMKGDQIS